MVSQTHKVCASIINNISAQMPRGRAIVEKQVNESTFIIRMPFGNLTVEVTEGSLKEGDLLFVNSDGENVLIEKLSVPVHVLTDMLELRSGPAVEELLVLLKDLRNILSSKPVHTDILAQLDSAIRFFDKTDTKTLSLHQVVNQIKNNIILILDPVSVSVNKEIISRISQILSHISENVLHLPVVDKEEQPARQSQVVTLTSTPAPGFYSVKNGSEALALLEKYSDTLDSSVKKNLQMFNEKPLLIRFYGSASGTKEAVAMTYKQAIIEIGHLLQTEMKSKPMQQLEPSIIAETIGQRGSLSMSHLMDIDKLLLSIPKGDRVNSLKEDAMRISLPQLIAISLEPGGNKVPQFESALTRIAPRIPDLVMEIIALLKSDSGNVKIGELKNLFSTHTSSQQAGNNENYLQNVFREMGFTLEKDMYIQAQQGTTAFSTGFDKDSPGLKLALLILLGNINTLAGHDGTDKVPGEEQKTRGALQSPETGKMPSQSDARPHDAAKDLPRMPIEMIRQQVETVLNRLESLQVLAKPVTTAEGEQQVLVLPINIGDEWVEARVKFIKKRSGKGKKGDPKQVSVMLHVDLSLLGEVTANIEYYVKKSLNVSVVFDNKAVTKWFQRNEKDFRKALTELGFKSVDVKIRNKSGKREDNLFGHMRTKDPDANIDIIG